MESKKFEEAKHIIAKDQDEFNPVHVHLGLDPTGVYPVITACFKLTKREIQEITDTGVIWYQQVTHQMRPMNISTNKPELRDR